MTSVWKWNLRQLGQEIWVPIALYAALGLATALGALVLKPFLPSGLALRVGAEAVATLLQILASSMLSVTTFSLSIMLAAFSSASSGATPRATALLKEDDVSRSVLATFVGVFIFSLTGLIGLQTGVYEEAGRLILFLVTLVVLGAVVVQLVRWIGHLAHFGRLGDTIDRLEEASAEALAERLANPYLGGHALGAAEAEAAANGAAIFPASSGYLQMIDLAKVNRLAEGAGLSLALAALPGSFLHPAAPLAHVLDGARIEPAMAQEIAACFVLSKSRTYAQDPRFGVLALAEVASRALSPAVNDPGTAIDILGRQFRVLAQWQDRAAPALSYPQIHVPGLRLGDLMTDAFAAIARDGAGLVEVQIRLQKMLLALVETAPETFGPSAARLSDRALALAQAALVLDDDKQVLRGLNAAVRAACAPPRPPAPST